MRKIIFGLMVPLMFYSCTKNCGGEGGQYQVSMYCKISPLPKLKLGKDSLHVKIWIPYDNSDLLIPSIKINLKNRKPLPLYISLSAPPVRLQDEWQGRRIHPLLENYIKVSTLRGILSNPANLSWEFFASDTAWEIEFLIVPTKPYDGVYMIGTSRTQYKDDCVQVDPVVQLINTPTNHFLVKERFDFDLRPGENDVLFYVE